MLGSLLPFQNKTLCLFFVLSLVALCLSAQQQTPIQNKTLVVFSFLNKENENQNLLDTHKNLIAIGVDAVNYINLLNLNSSPDIKKSINDYLKNREIKNILFYNEESKEINLLTLGSFLNNQQPYMSIKGDSVLKKLKEELINKKLTQNTFLYSPQPEVIDKVKVKPFNKILVKPNLENQKIGSLKNYNTNQPVEIVVVEEKEDYRFYYSNGINYFITFYKGTESFLKNTYGVDGLERGSNKETLILVLEHTATRNKLFYFNKEKTSEQELLSEFLSN